MKILLADDSLTAQNMGKKILSEAGYEVVTVNNGAAAAKKIAELKPELVLLDVFMPGYSGLELCERLRNAAETAKLPVLLMVGRMEPYNPQDGARVKADGVIVKPFEASDLTAAVERLAQKLKPAMSAMKMAPAAEFKDETYRAWKQETRSQSVEGEPTAAKDKPAEYEPTMLLDKAQIAAMLKPAEPEKTQPEFSVSAPAHSAEEFLIASVPEALAATNGSSFGQELPSEANSRDGNSAEMPSYMAQYLSADEDSASAEPKSAMAFPATAPLERFDGQVATEAPVAAAEGLELTAAAPVPDMPVARETGFEATAQSSEVPAVMPKDPALVTDPHAATMDFTTHFGTADPELADQLVKSLYGQPETEAAPVDEFEARLNAAMSSYREPAADLPAPAEIAPIAEAEAFVEQTSPTAQSFEAQVETAMHGFEASSESAPIESAQVSAPEPSFEVAETEPEPVSAMNTFEIEPPIDAPVETSEESFAVEPSIDAAVVTGETEFVPGSLEPRSAELPAEEMPAVDAVSSMFASHSDGEATEMSIESAATPETDEAVIQQMRETLSDLPIDHSHFDISEPAPLALAAAASASAPATHGILVPLGREAELEIARSLSTAMEVERHPVETESPETSDASPATPDSNNLAAAVEKVMHRELPSLIWKIMAEIDLTKRK